MRPAVSVEPQREREAQQQQDPDVRLEQPMFDISGLMLDKTLPSAYPSPNSDGLQADPVVPLDDLTFADAKFRSSLDDAFGNDFLFDDLINQDAVAFAVDPATGAA